MEEGDDPNFVSDTNNLITIKQKGPTIREIRDTDMGAAITYLLLDLEGVDTEPDILDDGKKGPWTIFATAECAEQFKGKSTHLHSFPRAHHHHAVLWHIAATKSPPAITAHLRRRCRRVPAESSPDPMGMGALARRPHPQTAGSCPRELG